jgi:hypothetical protein
VPSIYDLKPAFQGLRGTVLPVPLFCDVFVGEPVRWSGERKAYLEELRRRMQALAAQGRLAAWE